MKKLFLAMSLFLFSTAAYSQFDRYWLEVSGGVNGETVKLKVREGDQGWALLHSRYTEDGFFGPRNKNRETSKVHDTEFKVYGITKTYSMPYKWGYVDVGAGLGYGDGAWSENCEPSDGGFFDSRNVCDLKEGSSIGIPLHGAMTFGKYLGIGVNVDVFLSLERGSVTQVGLVIPFGVFTK